MNLDEIENDIISRLKELEILGRLYSEKSSKISNTFNPFRVSYRYWLNYRKNTQTTTCIHFDKNDGKKYDETIILTLEDILKKPFQKNIIFSGKNKSKEIFGKLLFEKETKKIGDSLVEIIVTITNQTHCENYSEDLCNDCPSLACSIFSFELEERCLGDTFQPDPRIKDDFVRYFVTENIVAYKISQNVEGKSATAEFKDYGIAQEEVQKPSTLLGTLKESLKDIFKVDSNKLSTFLEKIAVALKLRGIQNFYDFQAEAIKAISNCLHSEYLQNVAPSTAFLLHAATAGGKTEGFLLPIFMYSWVEHVQKEIGGVKAIIFYPTKALADDQYDRILYYLSILNEDIDCKNKIRLGILHGDVPKTLQTWCSNSGCNGKLIVEETEGKILIKCEACGKQYHPNEIAPPRGKCPFCNNDICVKCKSKIEEKDGKLFCPSCRTEYSKNMRLNTKIIKKKNIQKPRRVYDIDFILYHPSCGSEFDFVDFTRDKVFNNLPDILITNPDIIHTYMTKVPSRISKIDRRKYAFYDFLKIFRLFGSPTFYCSRCDFTFDSTGTCPLCRSKGVPLKSKPAFLVVDEIHLFKGNFGCNASGFFSNLISVIKELTKTCPICISSTATVANKEYPPACLFGFPKDKITVISPSNTNLESPYNRRHLFILPKGTSSISCLREILVAIFVDPRTIPENVRRLRNDRKDMQVLIFFDNKRNLYETNATLTEFTLGGAKIRAHSADISKAERRIIEHWFLSKKINVLLATSTLEVGVDFDELNLLINFGATYSYNSYLQRIGRVGRKGPALIINILRFSVPIDNYYFENYRELIVYSKQNVDIVPITRDIPKSVRRNVFPLTAALGVLTDSSWNPRLFYTNFLQPEFDKYTQYVKNVFMKPPILRINEMLSELDNVCKIIESRMSELIADMSDNVYLNDVLDRIARNDLTQRLDFNLRINEKEVGVSIEEPESFIRGLEGSLSAPEETDIEEFAEDFDIEDED